MVSAINTSPPLSTVAQCSPAWLRFKEACLYSSMTKHQLRPLLQSGEVYGKKVGRRGVWIVSRESIDNYLNEDRERMRLAARRILG